MSFLVHTHSELLWHKSSAFEIPISRFVVVDKWNLAHWAHKIHAPLSRSMARLLVCGNRVPFVQSLARIYVCISREPPILYIHVPNRHTNLYLYKMSRFCRLHILCAQCHDVCVCVCPHIRALAAWCYSELMWHYTALRWWWVGCGREERHIAHAVKAERCGNPSERKYFIVIAQGTKMSARRTQSCVLFLGLCIPSFMRSHEAIQLYSRFALLCFVLIIYDD